MKYSVLFLVLTAGATPLCHSQCCGYGMQNVTVWPQPDLRVPVPTVQEAKRTPPAIIRAAPAVQANAHALSLHFPQDKRAQMEKIYVQSMDVYLKVEKKMGWTPRDLAGGIAAFVVGNYMILNDTDVPDEAFDAVARQFRAQPALQKLAASPDQDKVRDVFEQSAMIGTFMALAPMSQKQQAQSPDVQENMRKSAIESLQLVLRSDPGKLRIDTRGMHE